MKVSELILLLHHIMCTVGDDVETSISDVRYTVNIGEDGEIVSNIEIF